MNALTTGPFRWNFDRHNEVGRRLLSVELPLYSERFVNDLLELGARVLFHARRDRLAFVGRSPESVYDLLCGLFADSAIRKRLWLLPFSMRASSLASVRRDDPGAIEALRNHLSSLQLDPPSIVARDGSISFIDLVESGETYLNLLDFYSAWATDAGIGWRAIRGKLHAIALVRADYASNRPSCWIRRDPMSRFAGVIRTTTLGISRSLWWYLAVDQPKVTKSHVPARWRTPVTADELRSARFWTGARAALFLRDLGRSPEVRRRFQRLLRARPLEGIHLTHA